MNAEELFETIPKGRTKPLTRPENSIVDRRLRKLIESARLEGRVIINNGHGYYEVLNDPVEKYEARAFLNKQKSRLRKGAEAIRAMEYTLDMMDQLSFEDIQEWR